VSIANDGHLRPFYFFVVVWGAKYAGLFANFCLPSLLAEGNLPALRNSKLNRLLVVTPQEDWLRIKSSPIFAAVSRYLEALHIDLPSAGPDDSVYDHMSLGHKLATQMAFHDKAYGVFLAPDMMISDGSLAAIEKLALDGVQVVLTPALRYGEEPLFEHFEKLGVVSSTSRFGDEGRPLTITGRQMAYAGINAFHNETLRFEWDAPYFAPFYTGLPGACWWRVPGEEGVLLHSSSWAPLLIDYAALAAHDSSAMDHWAIDGDYIHQNFGTDARIHVVQDSDEVMLVSWTPMHVLDLPRNPKRLLTLPYLGDFVKGALLRDAFLGPYSDPLKRRIFFLPLYFHARELNQAWEHTIQRARATLDKYLSPEMGRVRLLAMRTIGVINRAYVVLVGRWANRRRIFEMTGKALRGDPAALDFLRKRTKLYMRQLVGRSGSVDER